MESEIKLRRTFFSTAYTYHNRISKVRVVQLRKLAYVTLERALIE